MRSKAVDLDADGPAGVADALLAELIADDGLVEVGYRDGEPGCRVELRARSTDATNGELPLDERLRAC